MDKYLTPEQKEDMRKMFEHTLQEDILTCEDMIAIIEICEEALRRSRAALHEKMMIALLTDDEDEDKTEE